MYSGAMAAIGSGGAAKALAYNVLYSPRLSVLVLTYARLPYPGICQLGRYGQTLAVAAARCSTGGEVTMEVTNAMSVSVKSLIDAAAHDEPYRFGRRPTVQAPFPFTDRQFARLLIARSRVQAGSSVDDQPAA